MEAIISWSIRNRILVLIAASALSIWGFITMRNTPVDAIPDLSENQVIVFTEWMGRSPQIMEDQVTFPLVTNLQGIPKVKAIRAVSMFGMSFIFIVFQDDVETYWARTRVMERLAYAQKGLPDGIIPSLGPDGTGVGHVFWYTLDGPGYDLGELRALQDWYVKFGLQTVEGVSEVASFGGFEKQYQVAVDPRRLAYHRVTLDQVMGALKANNGAAGGASYQVQGMSYVVRGQGYVKSIQDIQDIAVAGHGDAPIRIRDVASVREAGDIRLGITEENGRGEVAGGIVVMRYGENAKDVIERVKTRMQEVEKGLPKGVRFKTAYDRSDLILASIDTLRESLIEEILVVSFVMLIFLFHFRSALVVILTIPLSVLIGFILMKFMGVTSNIMSLGGIALAIGDLVDSGIVLVEGAYRKLSEGQPGAGGEAARLDNRERIRRIESSSRSLARAVVFPLLVLIVSFAPILFLTGQERKLFGPMALTKTFVMMGAIVVSLTVVPALMAYLVKGKLRREESNPATRFFVRMYRPVLSRAFRWKKATVGLAIGLVAIGIPMVLGIGREFMPPLDEGSILLMPTLLPDVSNAEAKRVLQVQDRVLATFPEVANVLGKAGRASTATDNAPISMIETIILLKPRKEWRKGVDKDSLIREMEARLKMPGVVNGWTQPIINRINMLSTGIRTDVGVKVFGPELDTIYAISKRIEETVRTVPGLVDLYTEEITGGRFLDILVKREELGRYGLSVADVNMAVEAAIGGMPLTQTVEGRRRFDISVRLAEDFRTGLDEIRRIPISTPAGPIPLGQVAEVTLAEGPAMINSENAMLRGTVLFNARGRDMGGVAAEARERVEALAKEFPNGYFVTWSGQYENQLRAEARLKIILPIVLGIIVLIIFFSLRSWKEVAVVVASLPVSLVGGAYSMFLFGANFSVAVAVGFIALFGIAVQTGVLMVVYLNNAVAARIAALERDGLRLDAAGLDAAMQTGASQGLRPILMTVLANLFGILPVLLATGPGSDVMKPVILPFEFGLVTAILFAFLVLPVLYAMVKQRELKTLGRPVVLDVKE